MTHTSLKNLDWIRGKMWPSLLRLESAREKNTVDHYEVDRIDPMETVKGYVDHLLAKSRIRTQKIKWDHHRLGDFHSMRPEEIEALKTWPTRGERDDDDDEEFLGRRFVLDRIIPPATWTEDGIICEQKALNISPLRMDSQRTEQCFQIQMERRFAHPSCLELCLVRRDIHKELAKEMMRQLTCINVQWGIIMNQILLESTELIHHVRQCAITAVEFGLAKLNETEDAVTELRDRRNELEAEVIEWRRKCHDATLYHRDLAESIRSQQQILSWNNRLEREDLLERKQFLKDTTKKAARYLRNSFLWDEYDTMPIEPDIIADLMQELREEEARKEYEEFMFGETVETAVMRDMKPKPVRRVRYPEVLVDVDHHVYRHLEGVYTEKLVRFEALPDAPDHSADDYLLRVSSLHGYLAEDRRSEYLEASPSRQSIRSNVTFRSEGAADKASHFDRANNARSRFVSEETPAEYRSILAGKSAGVAAGAAGAADATADRRGSRQSLASSLEANESRVVRMGNVEFFQQAEETSEETSVGSREEKE